MKPINKDKNLCNPTRRLTYLLHSYCAPDSADNKIRYDSILISDQKQNNPFIIQGKISKEFLCYADRTDKRDILSKPRLKQSRTTDKERTHLTNIKDKLRVQTNIKNRTLQSSTIGKEQNQASR